MVTFYPPQLSTNKNKKKDKHEHNQCCGLCRHAGKLPERKHNQTTARGIIKTAQVTLVGLKNKYDSCETRSRKQLKVAQKWVRLTQSRVFPPLQLFFFSPRRELIKFPGSVFLKFSTTSVALINKPDTWLCILHLSKNKKELRAISGDSQSFVAYLCYADIQNLWHASVARSLSSSSSKLIPPWIWYQLLSPSQFLESVSIENSINMMTTVRRRQAVGAFDSKSRTVGGWAEESFQSWEMMSRTQVKRRTSKLEWNGFHFFFFYNFHRFHKRDSTWPSIPEVAWLWTSSRIRARQNHCRSKADYLTTQLGAGAFVKGPS